MFDLQIKRYMLRSDIFDPDKINIYSNSGLDQLYGLLNN